MSVRLGRYRMSKTLGIGSFGKVKLGEHSLTGDKVAIKILNRAKVKALEMTAKVAREVHILRLFYHPHIVRLYEVIETSSDMFLVQEYVSGGELFDYIVSKGRLHEEEARQFFQQITSGVAYCHCHNVVHRDLKPENLLLSGDHTVKIADFGLSNLMRDGEFLRTSCGSPNYAAPEVISGNLYAGPEVDVWGCGVILYALLCGSLPFDDESIPKLFKKIKAGVYTLPGYLSETSRDLITKMLVVDPMQRMSMAELRKHPWFRHRLPPYLALAPETFRTSQTRMKQNLDQDIVDKVVALFECSALQRAGGTDAVARMVRSTETNSARVAYELLLDRKENRNRVAEQRNVAEEMERRARLPRASVAFSPPQSPHSAPVGLQARLQAELAVETSSGTALGNSAPNTEFRAAAALALTRGGASAAAVPTAPSAVGGIGGALARHGAGAGQRKPVCRARSSASSARQLSRVY